MDVRRRTRGSASLPAGDVCTFQDLTIDLITVHTMFCVKALAQTVLSEIILMTVGGAQNALAYLFESGLPASKEL